MRRRHFALLHRYLGLALAVFLFVAGLGGAVVAFQREIDGWLNADLFVARRSGSALGASALAARVEAAVPRAELTYLPLAPAKRETVLAYVQPRKEGDELGFDQLAIDPASGEVQGRRLWGACCFERQNIVPFIYRLHYSLALPDAWGQWLMGCTAMAWLIDCFVGLYLTFPRKAPFWIKWNKRWGIRVSAGPHRAIYDSHNASGLWCWVLLLMLALSSIEMNLDDEVFRPVVSTFSSISQKSEQKVRPGASRQVGWDEAIAKARAEATRRGWTLEPKWVAWRRPENAYHVGFDGNDPNAFDTGSRRELLVAADTSVLTTVRDPGARTSGDVFIDLQYPLHTGRLLGFAGRVLVCVTGLATAGLSVTGVWLWLRRLRHGREHMRSRVGSGLGPQR